MCKYAYIIPQSAYVVNEAYGYGVFFLGGLILSRFCLTRRNRYAML